jgi:hypothetical protein
MAKIGRNSPCPCGSGKKYKRCCGNHLTQKTNTTKQFPQKEIPKPVKTDLEHEQAKELTRIQQQGLGKPIIATKFRDQQVVAVGNTIYISPKWKTVPDFLSVYLKKKIGEEWGNSEIKKKYEDRHPILQWYNEYCKLQQKHMDDSGKIVSILATGVVYCYLGLAYNLYLLDHNVELQQRYIERLKDINNFQGAYYELIVANCLIRSGFELELEDETDERRKHCEFSAVSKKTQKKYWVEAKMRAVTGILGKTTKNGTTKKDPTCMMAKHLKNALQKPANSERLIFIDVNTSFENVARPAWIERAGKKLDMKEKNLPPRQMAYVFVTNMGFHWDLNTDKRNHAILAHGLGIPDFGKQGYFRLSEIYKRKQRHIDAHEIMEAFREYPKIPPTFDGSLPSETFFDNPQHLKIGEKYFFEDIGENGSIATVTTATVDERKKILYIGTDKGQILTRPISENELADYRNHPDTFFGVVHKQGKRTDDEYEFFERLVEIHMSYPKSNILNQIENWRDADKLKKFSHEDLVLEYCERLVDFNRRQNQTYRPKQEP